MIGIVFLYFLGGMCGKEMQLKRDQMVYLSSLPSSPFDVSSYSSTRLIRVAVRSSVKWEEGGEETRETNFCTSISALHIYSNQMSIAF